MYVSIFGDERGREVALSGLKAKAKYVRGKLGKRMKLRLTPEIRFVEDGSLERGSRVSNSLMLFVHVWYSLSFIRNCGNRGSTSFSIENMGP